MAKYFSPKRGGQGLSQLQKQILAFAQKNGGEVLARDVLVHYYGFRPCRDIEELGQGALAFKKADIGPARYNCASVAICKAFNRLCDRRLATRIHGGVLLRRLNSRRSGRLK